MNFPIALQLYTVRDAAEADFEGTLKKVKSWLSKEINLQLMTHLKYYPQQIHLVNL